MPRPPATAVHVVVITHRVGHLPRVVRALTHQSRAPDSILISCDNDFPDVRAAVEQLAQTHPVRLTLVQRPWFEICRINQVRNNALRALIDQGAEDDAVVMVLDNDCLPGPGYVESALRAARWGDLIIGQRYLTSEAERDGFDEEALLAGREPLAALDAATISENRKRWTRDRRRCWLRRIGIGRHPAKPYVLGCNHGARLAAYKAVNGYDEMYEGWGPDDMDLGQRAYAAGLIPAVMPWRSWVWHMYHPERPREDEASKASWRRYEREETPTFAEAGLTAPREQPEPVVTVFDGTE